MGIIIYIFFINSLAFFLYQNDKHRAEFYKRRIPEIVLFGLAVVGGSFGALCSMWMFRHKIHKSLFKIGVPVLFLILCIILFLLGYPFDVLPDIDTTMF